MSDSGHDSSRLGVLVTARDERERIGATLESLRVAFPDARLLVADDASSDATAALARDRGVEVVSAPRRLGKGGAATLGARRLLGAGPERPAVILLCDADLGTSVRALTALVEAVERGEADLAVASFRRRVGGGLGLALGAAAAVIRRATGLDPAAPLSGQRALRAEALAAALPFARGFGMETAMTIDVHRAGFRLVELELDLEHRATGRGPAGFLHRGRQLLDILRVPRRQPRRQRA